MDRLRKDGRSDEGLLVSSVTRTLETLASSSPYQLVGYQVFALRLHGLRRCLPGFIHFPFNLSQL